MVTTFEEGHSNIRKFQVPSLNLKAKVYYEMTDVETADSEPPVTRYLTVTEVKTLSEVPLVLKHACHNQAVERHIKLVTEAASSVCGFERKDGVIRQCIKSRKLIKKFGTKRQFQL